MNEVRYFTPNKWCTSGWGQKRFLSSLCTVGLFCIAGHCLAQGTLQIRFDGPPQQPEGTSYSVQEYYEAGLWFRPLGIPDPGNTFSLRRGGGGVSFVPDNGSAYVATAFTQSLMFSFLDGSVFNLVSLDLAEYSTVVPNAVTVPFVGYRSDGSVVNTSFTTDGIIDGTGPIADFQTFYFGPEFSDLTRVEIPTYGWSLDNLVVAVPEPGTFSLLMLGVGIAAVWRFNRGGHEPGVSSRPSQLGVSQW